MDLHGKVALVTGAGVRVGRAIALELGRAGCDVAVHYRSSADPARRTAEEIVAFGRRAVTCRGDLADLATPERIVGEVRARLGRLDVLVSSASSFPKRALADSDAGFWEETLRLNLVAPALLARAAAPAMIEAGGGRIVNLADILTHRPPRGYAAYCTSKAGLEGLTRALAIELAPTITVNAIAPGIAQFPDDYDAETKQRLTERVPLKRPGTPEEVARLVRYLCTEGSYITGQIIPLDGGLSLRP